MIENEKAISTLEEILYKKDWKSDLREKLSQYKKDLGISFKVKE